jgi:hypothetical protein
LSRISARSISFYYILHLVLFLEILTRAFKVRITDFLSWNYPKNYQILKLSRTTVRSTYSYFWTYYKWLLRSKLLTRAFKVRILMFYPETTLKTIRFSHWAELLLDLHSSIFGPTLNGFWGGYTKTWNWANYCQNYQHLFQKKYLVLFLNYKKELPRTESL